MTSSGRPGKPDSDPRRLRELASAQCDESISDEQSRELEALLSASAAAREMYVEYMNLHAGLDWEITSHDSVADLAFVKRDTTAFRKPRSQPALLVWGLSAAAAALLIVGAVVFLTRDGARGARVALIKAGTPGAQWVLADRQAASPSELRSSDVLSVTSGEVEVTFDCGAIVTLYAQATLEAISPMKARAVHGRLAAEVAEGAQGFAIETPRATVIDLGTKFGVEVDDEGSTDVVVFKGVVDLQFDRPAGAVSTEASLRLTSGEAMRIDEQGTPSRIVSIDSDRFSSQLNADAEGVDRPILISAVTDNIARERGSWNYYEIVHGGMSEDAKAFVDRVAHEWNGLFNTGMPKFLIGGDFVKTFNNDKYWRDLELWVTIERPCRLFILIDDRVPPPTWLREGFRDTGFNVGLDVGPFHRIEDGVLIDDRQPGVGPGVLVDNVFSIWERTIDAPQVVHLGSNEADHHYINMYGIAAAPIDRP